MATVTPIPEAVEIPAAENGHSSTEKAATTTITERHTLAVWNLLIGLVVGLLGNVLFYGRAIGLSFPLFIGILVIGGLALSIAAKTTLRTRNLWPLIPVGFFAGMVAVRADNYISMLNMGAVILLGALTLHYLPLKRALDLEPLIEYVSGVISALLASLFAPISELVDSVAWLRDSRLRKLVPMVAVGRGLLIALPVLIVFAVLLGSADAVFADYLDKIWNLFTFQTSDELMGRALVTGIIGWLAVGALAYGLGRRITPAPTNQHRKSPDVIHLGANGDETAAILDDGISDAYDAEVSDTYTVKRKPGFQLGFIESGIVLGSVDLLFGAFVLVQLAYFFGGREPLDLQGWTYAQYARRGFFELLAVSLLTLGLVLWLDHHAHRSSQRETTIFRGLSLVMVGLTVVMLASAAQRMVLYEEAYGFTHMRVYTHVFMVWLGVLFGAFVLALFRLRQNVFALGVLVVSIGFLGTLNVMDVEAYIAQRNTERYYNDQALDVGFMLYLSADAVPAIIEFYGQIEPGSAVHDDVGQWLSMQLYRLDRMREGSASSIFSANLSRERAWGMLDAIRAELPQFDARAYANYSYGYQSRNYYRSTDIAPTAEPAAMPATVEIGE